MKQMTLNLLAARTDIVRVPEIPDAVPAETKSICNRTDLVDVSETTQDVGISHKMAVTGELYDRLQRCHPGNPYENEAVLWNVLWLGEFERSLHAPASVFTFTAIITCTDGTFCS